MKLLFLVISILFLSTLAQEFNQGFINYTVWTSTQFCGGTVYRYNEIEPSPHVVGYTTRNVDSILVLVCNATLQRTLFFNFFLIDF